MSRLLILIPGIVMFGFAAVTQAQEVDSNAIPFSGRVGNKIPIAVELSFTGRQVSGRYSYQNKLDWLSLEGTVSGMRITLVEREAPTVSSPEGKITGNFEGQVQLDSSITGTWRTIDGTRNLPFSLTRERFLMVPDSVVLTLEEFNDCDCYAGTRVRISDRRLSVWVNNTLFANVNEFYEDCPCENENGAVRGIVEEKKEVIFNKNNLLTIRTATSGIGAYPTSDVNYSNFSLVTGERITVPALFKQQSRPEGRDFLLELLKQRIERQITTLEQGKSAAEREDGKTLREQTVRIMEILSADSWPRTFHIDNDEIIFRYDLGYPHVMQAIAPSEDLSVAIDKLKTYLDPAGPLGFLLEAN